MTPGRKRRRRAGNQCDVTSRQRQQVEDMVEGEVAGSRHTLKQIIMPGRFSTVMKPKVNCFTMCFTKLSTLEVVPEQFWEVTGFSHSKSC